MDPACDQPDRTALHPHTDNLPGCNNCRLQVLASDGWNTVSATADGSFSLADRSPSIAIGYPTDGAVIPAGEPVTLLATAYDPEDGLLTGANIEWRSDRDGVLVQGISSICRDCREAAIRSQSPPGTRPVQRGRHIEDHGCNCRWAA